MQIAALLADEINVGISTATRPRKRSPQNKSFLGRSSRADRYFITAAKISSNRSIPRAESCAGSSLKVAVLTLSFAVKQSCRKHTNNQETAHSCNGAQMN